MTVYSKRRAFAVVFIAACATVSLPSSAAVNLLGTIAKQDRVPARLEHCSAEVDGKAFSPTIAFAQQPNPVARYTVLLAFFDRRNISVGHVDVTDHGADSYELPAGADSMTCAVARLTLDDGSTYPYSGAGNPSFGGVVLGVLGAGALAAIAIGVSHHTTSSTAPHATPTATASGATPSPAASGSTSTPTPVATPQGTATPSPFPTSSTTAIPTLRPQISRDRGAKTR